ncbi:MAG: ATP-binding protein [Candidatus Dojkabacteria bacterium]|nr:ATP-binding protein [Candidatus Dojkabacteria bacterium]
MLKRSIVTRIISIIVFVSMLVGSVLVGLVTLYVNKVLLDLDKEDLVRESEYQAKQIELRTQYSQSIAEHIASLSEIKNYLTVDKVPQQEDVLMILQHHYVGGEVFSALYLMDDTGMTYVSTSPDFVGKDYSFRPYFQKAVNGERSLYIAKGVTSNEAGFYASSRVMDDDGTLLGVVVVKINPTAIIEAISQELSRGSGRIMLIDNSGVIFFSTDESIQYKTLWPLSEAEKESLKVENRYPGETLDPLGINVPKDRWFVDGDFTAVEFLDEQGVDKLSLLGKTGDGSIYLFRSIQKRDLTYASLHLTEILSIMIFASIFANSGILFYVIKKQSNPLRIIESYSKEVSSGNFAFKVDESLTRRNDEIGSLSKSFEYMRERIRDFYKNMEIKIEDKTKDLGNKVKELEDTRVAMISLLEDVKEEKDISQKRAEELNKFMLAVENVSDHIVITDADGMVNYANKAVEKITGFDIREIIGQKAGSKQNWGGLMKKEVYEKMWDTIKKKKKVFEGEVQNKRKNGEKYTALASICPVVDDSDEVVFFVGIERDITKEKEVDRMKTEFVSIASHQLRTPLSAIRWTLEMLIGGDAGKLKNEQDMLARRAYVSTQRMVDLVNSLLNVSRIESGQLSVDPKATDIKKLASDVVYEFSKLIAQKKQKFDFDAGKMDKINTDPKLLREVVANLISNAVKYTPDEGEIEFRIERGKKDMKFTVKDSGIGIPEAEQKKLFTKFFRAENAAAIENEGNGLGLYLVKSLVELLGGEVGIKSEEGKGTEAWFTIPLAGIEKKEGTKEISPIFWKEE